MLIDHNELLEQSPLAILICDKFKRILWCNSLFLQQTALQKERVVGHLYSSLPLNAIDNSGLLVQFLADDSNEQIKFYYWQQNYSLAEGMTIHYFVREPQHYQNQPTSAGQKISHYKLPQRTSWIDFLDYEVSRSRRYDNPLCILKLHCLIFDNPEKVTEQILQQSIKTILMDELRWADMIGHTQQGSFLMVLPETPVEVVINLQQKLTQAIKRQFDRDFTTLDYQLVFAEAAWRKHDDSKKLLNRARNSLVKQLEALLANHHS